MSDRYFRVNECVFPYFRHIYNDAGLNERTVEIPLGEFFINNFGYGVTEVGAVMGYYGFNCGEVIDSHDTLPGVIKANAVFDIDYSGKNILSISTVEHFKADEYSNSSNEDSIVFLNKIVSCAKNYLITWPLNYNVFLDEYVKNSNFSYFIMKRVSADNKWVKDEFKSFSHLYDSPFPKANGICCVTNLESLL